MLKISTGEEKCNSIPSSTENLPTTPYSFIHTDAHIILEDEDTTLNDCSATEYDKENRRSLPQIFSRLSLQRAVLQMAFLFTKLRNSDLTGTAAGVLCLVVWFTLNIAITLASKAMFSVWKFPFPMILTAVHLIVTWTGCQICSTMKLYNSVRIPKDQWRSILIFSLIFTSNIFFSNYGLVVVSVSVHQITRTLVPLITMGLSLIIYREVYPWSMTPPVATVCFGVGLTMWGDVHKTTFYGGVVVFVGCLLSSLKGLMSQKAQVGPKGLPTMDLLRYMCPLAVMQLFLSALVSGEFANLIETFEFTAGAIQSLFLQGLIAFLLNVVSFKCSALLSPLTMNIAGNMKQAITPLIALQLFGGSVTTALVFGLIVSTGGAIWYTQQSRKHKIKKAKLPTEILGNHQSRSAPPTIGEKLKYTAKDSVENHLESGDSCADVCRTQQQLDI